MPIQNVDIATMFDQTADLLELKGADPFRIRAYRRAARTVDGLPQSVRSMLEEGRDLAELPAIGEDLAGKIGDIVRTGHFDVLDTLKAEVPADVGAMAALPGLGPKRLKLLMDNLNIRSLAELHEAAWKGRLAAIPGFGPGLVNRLLEALEKPPRPQRFRRPLAEAEADALLAWLQADGTQAIVAGSYRRRRDTVGDLDVLVAADDGKAVAERLVRYENVTRVIARGATRTAVALRSGLQVDLRVVPPQSYGAALLYFTGSKAHNIALRQRAKRLGWKLSEYGLFCGTRQIAGADEQEVYEKLGLAFIPPEMREDRGEIALAESGRLPRLVDLADIRGDLHVHSSWTDGTVDIEAMALGARALGREYIALTDHSPRITVVHGLDAAQLARQAEEIDRLNTKLKDITVLKGIEVDILKDGSLDLPDPVLAKLDVVVASVHSHFDLPREAQTQRVIKAMRNRNVSILGHPTCRLIGERAPIDLDMDRVIAAARDSGCHLELNAGPDRLDIDDSHAHAAREAGVKVAISTDAHTIDFLKCMRFGVDQGRRGWLTPQDVINTRPLEELRSLLKR